jgi:hypothetical protein
VRFVRLSLAEKGTRCLVSYGVSGALGRKHFHGRSAELQIPPLRYASVGMTKGRMALPFRSEAEDDEQQAPPLRFRTVGMTLLFGMAVPRWNRSTFLRYSGGFQSPEHTHLPPAAFRSRDTVADLWGPTLQGRRRNGCTCRTRPQSKRCRGSPCR